MDYNTYLVRGKCIITISLALILISSGLMYEKIDKYMSDSKSSKVDALSTMSTSNIKKREYVPDKMVLLDNKKDTIDDSSKVKRVNASITNSEIIEEVVDENITNQLIYTPTWHRPVEVGVVSNNISYSHVAYDITSPRGVGEAIYPISDGVVSSIYTDSAGALIVVVNHNIDGVKYASMYVHLSRYADGLHVGQEIRYTDVLGYMGTTGYSTGVHLHISLVDCNFGDINCEDVGAFFNYLRLRYNQGYRGISMVMNVPYSWNSRDD